MPVFHKLKPRYLSRMCGNFLLTLLLTLFTYAPAALALQEQTEGAEAQEQDVVEDVAFKDNFGRDTPRSSFVGFLTATEKFDYE